MLRGGPDGFLPPGPQVVTAGERAFGLSVPHKALVTLTDTQAVARYFVNAARAAEEVQRQRDEHWSRTLPPNVTITGIVQVDKEKHARKQEALPELITQLPNDDRWSDYHLAHARQK